MKTICSWLKCFMHVDNIIVQRGLVSYIWIKWFQIIQKSNLVSCMNMLIHVFLIKSSYLKWEYFSWIYCIIIMKLKIKLLIYVISCVNKCCISTGCGWRRRCWRWTWTTWTPSKVLIVSEIQNIIFTVSSLFYALSIQLICNRNGNGSEIAWRLVRKSS